MIESMAVGLVEAAKQMGADSLRGMLSTGNTEPKLAMSVMSSKKRSLADEDVLDVAADSEVALRTFEGLIHGGAKKPRIHQPVVPAFAFTAKGWVDPKVKQAEADVMNYDVDEAVEKVEGKRDTADPSYDPSGGK